MSRCREPYEGLDQEGEAATDTGIDGRTAGAAIAQSPPYAIPYGWWIPNPIYGYRYGVGIMRLIRMVVDMRADIGESGSEKKSCTLLRSKS